jgi:hypothetical protein
LVKSVSKEEGTRKEVRICPKCGLPYDWVERRKVGNRVYLLAVHVVKDRVRSYRRFCYLGPAEGYAVGRATHGFMELRGFELDKRMDVNRLLEYLRQLLSALTGESLYGGDSELRMRVLGEVRRILEEYLARVGSAGGEEQGIHD